MISNSVVVDTNLVFSALIPRASKIRDILFESNINFYSPNILISEIFKHKDKLLKSSKLTESEFDIYSFVKKIKEENSSDIKQEHKDIVRLRIQRLDEHPESCLQWEDIENSPRAQPGDQNVQRPTVRGSICKKVNKIISDGMREWLKKRKLNLA